MRSYEELKAVWDATEIIVPFGMTAEEVDFLYDEMVKRDVCSEESPDWKAYADPNPLTVARADRIYFDYVRKTPVRLMPLFGGPAHGQWVALPEEVNYELVCGEEPYFVSCTQSSVPIFHTDESTGIVYGRLYWWAATEKANETITFDEIRAAYV
jgi:hypothetical protein